MNGLLEAHHVYYRYPRAREWALRDVSLTVYPGRSVGVVGESGSGKTTLTRLLLGFASPTSGSVLYDGFPVRGRGRASRRDLRRGVQLVLQDPFSSLNPRMRVAQIVAEPLRLLLGERRPEARVATLLEMVGLEADIAHRLPHELSGGQRQRVAIARALGPRPRVLIADEPVSALDVSVRLDVLRLLQRLAHHEQLTLVVVSHDLGLVQRICQETLVMHTGRVVEHGETTELMAEPRHPYTRELLDSVPQLPQMMGGVQ